MTLFARLCNARLRGGSGQTCRAFALKGHPHCRLHQGRPKHSGSPEGRAATRAGHTAYYAKYRAAKARGETVRPSGGRPKKWLIPRPWRFELSESEQAAVLAHMAAYDVRVRGGEPRPPWQRFTSRRAQARDLERLERGFILALNDHARPLSSGEAERVYDNIRQYEAAYELLFGPEPGSDTRLRRLEWEITRFRLRRATGDTIARFGEARGAQTSTSAPHCAPRSVENQSTATHEPPNPFAGPDDCPVVPVEGSHHFGVSAPPSPDPRRPVGMSDAAWQRVIAQSEAIVTAGRATGRRFAGERVAPARRHSIAPWIHRR